jgi:hypothetical protein
MSQRQLLSLGVSNAKTAKSEKKSNYSTLILYLSPYKLSGKNFCPSASPGCVKSCLFTAGRGAMSSVEEARQARSELFIKDRQTFLEIVRQDIRRHIKRCKRNGKLPAVRMNGTSDLPWEAFRIMQEFPSVQFYDYTAIHTRAEASVAHPVWPKNYHLTFSRKENNEGKALELFGRGVNVAVVFRKTPPKTWKGLPVFNGDNTDLRFLDPKGMIIGLTAKGKAKKDTTGFVVDVA